MSNFWTNIQRYPRFFISSLVGLILVIITPFRNLLKIPKLRPFLGIGFVLGIIFLVCIIHFMSSSTNCF